MKLLPEGRAGTGPTPKPKKRRSREPWESVFGIIFLFLGLNLMSFSTLSKSPAIMTLMAVLCFLLGAHLLPRDTDTSDDGDDPKDES